jgi:hypothetical protein
MKFCIDSLYCAKLAEGLIFIKFQKLNAKCGEDASVWRRLAGAAR